MDVSAEHVYRCGEGGGADCGTSRRDFPLYIIRCDLTSVLLRLSEVSEQQILLRSSKGSHRRGGPSDPRRHQEQGAV